MWPRTVHNENKYKNKSIKWNVFLEAMNNLFIQNEIKS